MVNMYNDDLLVKFIENKKVNSTIARTAEEAYL